MGRGGGTDDLMKYVLAFDAATDHVAIGLAGLEAGGYRTFAAVDFAAPRAALGRLLPATNELLESAGLTVSDLAAVAVGRGPGSFTGVRIAVATAKGLAHGLGLPLAGLGTLDAVAWRFKDTSGLVGVVGDAMRGEVYPCLFRCSDGVCERLDEYDVAKPAAAAAAWAESLGEPVTLTGNGLVKYAEVFSAALGDRATIAPGDMWTATGASVIDAAFAGMDEPRLMTALRTPEATPPGILLPVYTRLSDAEENEAKRAGEMPSSGVAGPEGGCA